MPHTFANSLDAFWSAARRAASVREVPTPSLPAPTTRREYHDGLDALTHAATYSNGNTVALRRREIHAAWIADYGHLGC